MIRCKGTRYFFRGKPESLVKEALTLLCLSSPVHEPAVVDYCVRQCEKGYGRSLTLRSHGSPLHIACFFDLPKIAQACVRGGHDVNLLWKGKAPIHCLLSGDVDDKAQFIDLLAAGGADLSAEDDAGDTPLMIAVAHGHHATVAQLLSHNVDPNLGNKNLCSALQFAVLKDDFKTIQLLLVSGARVNAIDQVGRIPLHLAGSPEVVALLLQHGASAAHCDETNRSPLAAMVSEKGLLNRSESVYLLLLSGSPLTGIDWSNRSVPPIVRRGWEWAAPTLTNEQKSYVLSGVLAEGGKGAAWAAKELLRLAR